MVVALANPANPSRDVMDVIKVHQLKVVVKWMKIDVKLVDMCARMVMLIVVKHVLKKTEFTVNGRIVNQIAWMTVSIVNLLPTEGATFVPRAPVDITKQVIHVLHVVLHVDLVLV